jgi:small subunit ribosomal protein S7
VDRIKYLVTSLRKIKLIKGQHAPQVNSWHTASRKVSGKINHKMTKSVFKNTPKGSRLKQNNKEYPLNKKVSSHRKLDHGKHFPQLHSWLNGGKQLLDQVNLKVVRSFDERALKNKPLQRKPFYFSLNINPSPFLLRKQRNKKQYNNILKGSMQRNITKNSIFQEKIMGQAGENKIIIKFTNLLMLHGKKSKALSTLCNSLKFFKKNIKDLSCNDPFLQNSTKTKNKNSMLNYLDQAVSNVKPCLEVRKKKISGIMRQIPAVPSLKRQETLGIRWIIESARKRRKKNYKPFFQCLAEELLDAFQNQGEPHKRKQALHRTAEANRIYIRHRWW